MHGWSNQETWAVAIWIDHTNSLLQEIADLAAEYSHSVSKAAAAIQRRIEQEAPTLEASMFAELLGIALDRVDWHEIAERYAPDTPEEEEDDEATA